MNAFEKTIKAYLDKVAQSDAVFAQKYDEAKIEGCCSYIISEVRKSGRQGFADEEIYGMAIHFFDERLGEFWTKDGRKVHPTHWMPIELPEER